MAGTVDGLTLRVTPKMCPDADKNNFQLPDVASFGPKTAFMRDP